MLKGGKGHGTVAVLHRKKKGRRKITSIWRAHPCLHRKRPQKTMNRIRFKIKVFGRELKS